jgi:hypothetical protein
VRRLPQVVLQLRAVPGPLVVLARLAAALQVALALLVAARQLALAARLWQAPAPLRPDWPALGRPDLFLLQEELVLAADFARAKSV